MSDPGHPADGEAPTPRSIEIPAELRAAPSERAAAILLELAQLRTAMQDLSAEIRSSLADKHAADDARFKKLETRIHELERELKELDERYRKLQVANDQDRRERSDTIDAIKKYMETLADAREGDLTAFAEGLAEVKAAAQAIQEYRADSEARSAAILRVAAVQSVIVEDLGYELDDNGVPKKPDPDKPTKLTRAAEASKGTRALIVLTMLQIIWQLLRLAAGAQFADPPAVRQPTTMERAQ